MDRRIDSAGADPAFGGQFGPGHSATATGEKILHLFEDVASVSFGILLLKSFHRLFHNCGRPTPLKECFRSGFVCRLERITRLTFSAFQRNDYLAASAPLCLRAFPFVCQKML